MNTKQKVRAARRAIERLMVTEGQMLETIDDERAAMETVRRFRRVLRSLGLSFLQFAGHMDAFIGIELQRSDWSPALEEFTFCTMTV